MKPRKRWKLLALSLLPLALLAARLCRPHDTSPNVNASLVAVLKGHRLPVLALTFSRDGSALASAAYYYNAPGSGTEVTAWDVGAGTPLAKRTESLERLHYLAFAPGGLRLAAAQVANPGREVAADTQGHSLWLWETAYAHEKGLRVESPAPVCTLAFSEDGTQVAVADCDNGVAIVDAITGRQRTRCKRQDLAMSSLAFSPDGTILVSGSWGGTIWLWDAASGEERGVLRAHNKPVFALAFSPDGRTLATGDMAGVVRLWDVAAKTVRATLGTFEDEVVAVAFSPDGATLAVATGRTVRLWDVSTGDLVANLEGHEGRVKCLAFSPDGTLLASGGYDRTIRLWRVTRAGQNF
jgi:WD40 repeat protein